MLSLFNFIIEWLTNLVFHQALKREPWIFEVWVNLKIPCHFPLIHTRVIICCASESQIIKWCPGKAKFHSGILRSVVGSVEHTVQFCSRFPLPFTPFTTTSASSLYDAVSLRQPLSVASLPLMVLGRRSNCLLFLFGMRFWSSFRSSP